MGPFGLPSQYLACVVAFFYLFFPPLFLVQFSICGHETMFFLVKGSFPLGQMAEDPRGPRIHNQKKRIWGRGGGGYQVKALNKSFMIVFHLVYGTVLFCEGTPFCMARHSLLISKGFHDAWTFS